VIASKLVRSSAIALAICLLAGATATAHAECKPTAVAAGDPALVQTLVARLAASGIATTPSTGCPAVRVKLEQRGPQVHVTLSDAFQRAGERDVQDVATAAAIIESWTYQEVNAGSLPPEPTLATAATAPPIARPPAARSGIAASFASAIGSDGGSTWLGGSIAACARIGPLCAGAMARAAADTHATGATSIFAQNTFTVSAMATLDLPRWLGGFVITPGIGIGYGYLRGRTPHHDPMGNPIDADDHELRLGAHASLARPISGAASVFADVWADAAALRSDSQFGPDVSVAVSLGVRLEAR
jgi:hypothetical protein